MPLTALPCTHAQSEDENTPDNPMSPEQIAMMLDRQIALTQELDVESPAKARATADRSLAGGPSG